MRAPGVIVLLVGNRTGAAARLENYLLNRGCDLCFAHTGKEALELFRRRRFDLILSDFRLSDGTVYQLIPPLRGTHTTMFFSIVVEEGCWWMNAVYEGQDRMDEPGMRNPQFKIVLDDVLFKKRMRSSEERRDTPVADQADKQAVQGHRK
jgi:DNA-binding NtrC family response regulator